MLIPKFHMGSEEQFEHLCSGSCRLTVGSRADSGVSMVQWFVSPCLLNILDVLLSFVLIIINEAKPELYCV